MTSISLAVWMTLSTIAAPATGSDAEPTRGIFLAQSLAPHSASLLQTASLDASWRPSESPPMRLTDGLRLATGQSPLALDQGGGLSSDLRQILALILGFIPGFGIGHLIAGDSSGFILFLIIDIVLYVAWGVVGFGIFHGGLGLGLGGIVWLVVHIIQAIDAYGSAGGGRLVQLMEERTLHVASKATPRDPLRATAKVLEFAF